MEASWKSRNAGWTPQTLQQCKGTFRKIASQITLNVQEDRELLSLSCMAGGLDEIDITPGFPMPETCC